MCCPFFDPARPLHGTSRDAMLPLGDRWAGMCRANPESAVPPPPEAGENSPLPLCNLGYARHECPRFPGGGMPDAVRFTAASDGSGTVRLYYVMERDHQPFAHGPLEISSAGQAAASDPAEEILRHQAAAYLESYRRRNQNVGLETCPTPPASKGAKW